MTCVFSSSLRLGKPVQKSTESKAARGTMVRWMAEMGAEGPDDLKRFDMGFRFPPELSNESGPRQTFRLHETLGKKRERRRRVRG